VHFEKEDKAMRYFLASAITVAFVLFSPSAQALRAPCEEGCTCFDWDDKPICNFKPALTAEQARKIEGIVGERLEENKKRFEAEKK
jgi:hypothetical protein